MSFGETLDRHRRAIVFGLLCVIAVVSVCLIVGTVTDEDPAASSTVSSETSTAPKGSAASDKSAGPAGGSRADQPSEEARKAEKPDESGEPAGNGEPASDPDADEDAIGGHREQATHSEPGKSSATKAGNVSIGPSKGSDGASKPEVSPPEEPGSGGHGGDGPGGRDDGAITGTTGADESGGRED